ncbi:MAG: DUF2927 domain-containing protein [Alphaproteobacteria bacterium]|nr:DUF2927 domain-containing protein [Alphaproteobacteria bacterium]
MTSRRGSGANAPDPRPAAGDPVAGARARRRFGRRVGTTRLRRRLRPGGLRRRVRGAGSRPALPLGRADPGRRKRGSRGRGRGVEGGAGGRGPERAAGAHRRRHGARVDDFLAASIEEGFCRSTYWAHGAGLVRAASFVTGGEPRPGRDGRGRRCLNPEMAHLLGLTYHPADAYSVLDEHTASDRYTPTDTMLLRLLYAPDLSPGRPRAEALAAVARRVCALSP